jgi:ABC-2 type transport system permease protein
MSTLRPLWLVARREISERFHGRAMWVVTGIMVAAVVALAIIPAAISSGPRTATIGLVGQNAKTLAADLATVGDASGVAITTLTLPDAAAATAAVEAGTIDAAVSYDGVSSTVTVQKSLAGDVKGVIQTTLNRAHLRTALDAAGIPLGTVTSALAPVPISVDAVAPPPAVDESKAIAAIVTGALLYMVLLTYGSAIATGVAQEKTSRTAEVLLSAVRSRDLLAGKILGIGVAGITQLAIVIASGLAATAAVGSSPISQRAWALMPASLIWFVLGYGLYSLAFAAAGALVSRQEDLQFAMAPIIPPLVAAFIFVEIAIGDPGNAWVRWTSFFPAFTPMVMPVRIAVGDVPIWEVALSIALTLAAIWWVMRVASRIYANAFLQGGGRISWGAALRQREERRSDERASR